MSETPENVVVVGASLAGLRTIEALRRKGYQGRITCIGAEPHMPYDRPPLSKDVLAGKWDVERTALRKPDAWDELEVEWRLGAPASALDLAARRVAVGNDQVPYGALFITTGGTPRSIPGTPALAGIHTLRTIDDCLAIRAALDRGARVAVVGAGFIGGEVAATCRGRGLAVTMIEALPVPLEPKLGHEMGERIADLHRDQGVKLRLGVGVEGMEGGDRVEAVRLQDGTRVEADVVVVGIGVAPETRWLEGSGLELRDGVVCDSSCRAAPDVYAAGDVARWLHPTLGDLRIEHWTNATEQADAAVSHFLGEDGAEPYAPAPYFWSDQFDVKIQFAGNTQPGDSFHVVDGALDERRFTALYGRGDAITGVLGFSRPRLVMKYRRMMREGVSLAEALAASA